MPLPVARPILIALLGAAFTAGLSAARAPAGVIEMASGDSTPARWPMRSRDPVRVWVQPTAGVSHWSATYVDEVRYAFDAWNELRLGLRFRFVADSLDGEIRVAWVDRFSEPISGRTVCMSDDANQIVSASIALAVHHRDGVLLDDDDMHAMALHEIGHALGLSHLRDSTSVMAPRVRVGVLSSADRTAARRLYSRPAVTVSAVRH